MEECRRKLEAERTEHERQKRIEQGRIDRLLRDAAAFQQAAEIRKYVEAIALSQARNRTGFQRDGNSATLDMAKGSKS